ncbi:MAG: hypothetical protein Q4A78_10455 [Peptostreptococcaceae bacterium]|nr:hypothetical protein [Peptostreptococcaceae bacterium]
MIIRVENIYSIPSNAVRNIEKISENFLLINIWIKPETFELASRALYGLYYFDDIPPMEIGFDFETGLLKEFTIFVHSSNICWQKLMDIPLVEMSGYPSADLGFARKHQYYYDEVCNLEMYCCNQEFWFFLQDHVPFKKIGVNKDISILLDSENCFIGAVIQNLSQDELNLLVSE